MKLFAEIHYALWNIGNENKKKKIDNFTILTEFLQIAVLITKTMPILCMRLTEDDINDIIRFKTSSVREEFLHANF